MATDKELADDDVPMLSDLNLLDVLRDLRHSGRTMRDNSRYYW